MGKLDNKCRCITMSELNASLYAILFWAVILFLAIKSENLIVILVIIALFASPLVMWTWAAIKENEDGK